MIETDTPSHTAIRPRWMPDAMHTPPQLDMHEPSGAIQPRYALLINPFYAKDAHASFGKHVLTPTLALTSFAATTPSHWRVEYWDENLLDGRPPFRPMPEVVGITVHLTFARRAYELADWYRARGSKVILGGLHVLSCPEECAPHSDALALGDGVQLWPKILLDIERGSLHPQYVATYENDYCDDPPPRRSILPRHSFLTTTSLIATRGCHNRCGFCYLATDGLRMPYRMKRPEQIVAEFEADDQPYAVFIDNNLGSRRDYLHALCQALGPIHKIWSAAVTIDVTDDPSLIRNMALAGCTGVFIGFESLSDENLAEAHKKTPKTSDYARRVRMLHDYGIQVNGSFVLGFDHDRKDVFARTAEWIEQNRMECATFHILTPYPATPLFRQLEAEGRILHRDWTLYDTGHAVFRPKHMTPEELEHGYAWIYQRLFSHGSIWRRRPEDWQAVPLYLAMSYLYKRSNRFWHLLIKHDLVNAVWRPLVEVTRWRHVRYRKRLARRESATPVPGQIVSAGV
ncbi:MAG TPA: radical SAM protein [Candidatus Sulfotelmatobacter sp.]|nr:radical SAM protein [Candidatus Sulfotelmatobacter sp.]